jgi:hypothetical protein
MKRFFGFALMLAMVAAPAFGSSKKSPTVTIPTTVQVGSTKVPAGDYKLTWTGSGSNVQATLTQNQKAVVTFSAKVIDEKSAPGVETNTQGGADVLNIIHLSNVSLELEGAPSSGQ